MKFYNDLLHFNIELLCIAIMVKYIIPHVPEEWHTAVHLATCVAGWLFYLGVLFGLGLFG